MTKNKSIVVYYTGKRYSPKRPGYIDIEIYGDPDWTVKEELNDIENGISLYLV